MKQHHPSSQDCIRHAFWLAAFTFSCLSSAYPAQSQIASDGTLSTNVTTTDNLNFTINDGNRVGNNLFHSFREFSVLTGGSAAFNNAGDIQNIFSRVTGNSISNIDGLIRANGAANLFLLNPNGIIFGPNARLNIGGSFLASTANSLQFADGTFFSTTPTQTTPLLTISVPVGLQYGGKSGEIRVQGNGQDLGFFGATERFDSALNPLEVLPGKTLALVGGNVIVDGGILQASGGRVEIGGLAGEGTVGLNVDPQTGNFTSLQFPDGVARGDVSIANQAGINVLAGGGGSIAVTGRNLEISDSLLSAGIATGLGSIDSMAGDIRLDATKAIAIISSVIENNVNPNGIGNSGNIEITTKSLSLTDDAVLATNTLGQGNAGNVEISASNTVSFDRGSLAFSSVQLDAVGRAGDIEITTESLFVTGGAQLQSFTLGQGDAGSVKITASDTVSFDGVGSNGFASAAGSTVQVGAVGKGGDIEITAKSLFVAGGALLQSFTFGQGDAGNVKISASDTVSVDGASSNGESSGVLSAVGESAVGKGGGIEITTKSLFVTGGAFLSASTRGQGDAGVVKISASDTVSFDGVSSYGLPSGAATLVQMGAVGKGGDIEITTKSLTVKGGAQLVSSTFAQGDAGSVKITASDTVSFDGGDAFSTVEMGAVGHGGDIEITTESLAVTGGAQLQALTSGQGDAGSVRITASDTVSFDGVSSNGFSSAAFSSVEAGAVGKGGSIEITTDSLLVTGGAALTASSLGIGEAGDILVNAGSIHLDNKALISANTTGGEGNITLRSRSLQLTRGSQITTDATGGTSGGNIDVKASSLILRQNSLIATNATGTEVKGGNIILNTDVIAALEDSDISANSKNFFGGRVIIDAQSVFGTQFREAQTLESDITATGGTPEQRGTVQINTPEVDPSSGLIELPQNFVDATALVDRRCESGRDASSFVVTGRGGLPPSPNEPLSGEVFWEDWRSPSNINRLSSVERQSTTDNRQRTTNQIVEATGWIIGSKGEIILTAEASIVTPHRSGLAPVNCDVW